VKPFRRSAHGGLSDIGCVAKAKTSDWNAGPLFCRDLPLPGNFPKAAALYFKNFGLMTPEGIGSRVFSCPFGAWKLLAILRPSRDFKFAHYRWQTNHIPGHPQGCSLVLWFTKKNKVNLRSFSWSLHTSLQVSSFPNKNHPLLMLFGNCDLSSWLIILHPSPCEFFHGETLKPTHRGSPAENASPYVTVVSHTGWSLKDEVCLT